MGSMSSSERIARCPHCALELQHPMPTNCETCGAVWNLDGGILRHGSNSDVDLAIGRLAEATRTHGWAAALYAHAAAEVASGGSLPEDPRSADWTYFLETGPSASVLVHGVGFGAVPLAFGRTGAEVWAADRSADRLRVVEARLDHDSCPDLHLVQCEALGGTPFPNERFDVVAVPGAFSRADIPAAYRLLRPHGFAQFTIPNSLGFQRFIGRQAPPTGVSLVKLRRLLRREGFTQFALYAPLPSAPAAPLFYLPLDSPEGVAQFFEDVMQLLELVSPEMRRRHGAEYATARVGASIARRARLTWLARNFVPSFLVLAQKGRSPK